MDEGRNGVVERVDSWCRPDLPRQLGLLLGEVVVLRPQGVALLQQGLDALLQLLALFVKADKTTP